MVSVLHFWAHDIQSPKVKLVFMEVARRNIRDYSFTRTRFVAPYFPAERGEMTLNVL